MSIDTKIILAIVFMGLVVTANIVASVKYFASIF